MSLKTRVGLLAGATALTLTGVSVAGPASNDDVAQRLAAAEAKIAAMEAANNQNWLTEQRAAEIKGLVQDVLADADTRSCRVRQKAESLDGLPASMGVGHGLKCYRAARQQEVVVDHQFGDGNIPFGIIVLDHNRFSVARRLRVFNISPQVPIKQIRAKSTT